jgi:hypothetical protein
MTHLTDKSFVEGANTLLLGDSVGWVCELRGNTTPCLKPSQSASKNASLVPSRPQQRASPSFAEEHK